MTLEEAIKRLDASLKAMQRLGALMKMSRLDNPYFHLVRVMAKLELIKDWPTQ